MQKFLLAFLFMVLIAMAAPATEIRFLKQPALTPDGQKIVFSYDNDLWIVSSTGGVAYRLTGMPGAENYPRISPDGKWLAFAGTLNGDANIYVMPLTGGDIRQLSYNDAAEQPSSWSWDSQFIFFTSSGFNDFTAFKVSRSGGTPLRLVENYFNTPCDLVVHPASGEYYFTDSQESFRYAKRKGYQGDYNPDIKSYHPLTRDYKIHTTYRGKDFQPVIDKNGNIYFISDESNGEFNLYSLKEGKRQQLTAFDSSIFNLQVAADGGSIVFEKDYQLWVYDVATKYAGAVPIELVKYNDLHTGQDFHTDGKISNFDVSNDGKKIAFVSRGELFVSDSEGKFVRQLKILPGERAVEVKWLKDNRTLLYNATVEGWLNLFTTAADGKSPGKQISFDQANNRMIGLNNAGKKAVYLSGRAEVRLLDLATWKSEIICKEELWGFDNDQPRFSPDDNYLAFSAYRNLEKDLFLYDFREKKLINITASGTSESEPFWSPDGKYLYFSSDRLKAQYPGGSQNSHIYRIPLQVIDKEFRSVEFDKLFSEEKAAAKKKDAKNKEAAPQETPPHVSIDFSELWKRWEQISPAAGQQFTPFVIKQDNSSIVFYNSNHDGKKANLWKTTLKPFEEPETVKISGAELNDLAIIRAKDNYYLLVNGSVHALDLKENKVKPVKIDFTFRKNLQSEFKQMFFETWASLQENYYDENFHGRDWNKIRSYYVKFLLFIQSRADLRTLLADMLGELNSSHLAFRSQGDEEKTFFKMQTMQTGIIFMNENPYAVKYVVKRSPADKKDIDLKAGDVLVSVNGVLTDPAANRDFYFTAPSPDTEMTLGFQRGAQSFTIRLHPENTAKFKERLYDEWIEDNQKQVDSLGAGRVAYVYMKNMGNEELQNFIIEMTTEWYKKDALILDLRFNTGGNVHDEVLNFLSRKPYLQWKYRGGSFAPQPNFAPGGKPIVLLVNEQSLSDAEMTAAGFKALKLGKIIGTETYRWLIFTSGKTLVDGSFYRLPSWGCFTLDGKDIERNGVVPDIYVKTGFKDRLEGKDPQLERAIAEILRELK